MDGVFSGIDPSKCLKTYSKANVAHLNSKGDQEPTIDQLPPLSNSLKTEELTTKNAVKFLLEGTLKLKVCRYCLKVVSSLSHVDQIIQVAGKGAFYKVAIKDMIASFHPFKVEDDPNFPTKICESCLDRAISSYLFTQQCEQADRALRNCFEDVYDKLNKLDPIERIKKRGRQKLHPNYNIISAANEKVMEYAEPLINIVNTSSEVITEQSPINALECLKCFEILPNMESLINHMKKHPTSMWFNCRLCGTSFAKQHQLKRHFRIKHSTNHPKKEKKVTYECKRCATFFEKSGDYLQHIEKHKFKVVMEHLIEKKMDRLCSLCFSKGEKMTLLDRSIYINGICCELNGYNSLRTILASTLPEIKLDTYTGTKVCEKCLNNALTSYVFINQSYFSRRRLAICVASMLDKLDTVTETKNNICVEIATNLIVNVKYDEESNEDVENENNSKVEVLEDEFRLPSEDESETESDKIVESAEIQTEDLEEEAKLDIKIDKTEMNVMKVNDLKVDTKANLDTHTEMEDLIEETNNKHNTPNGLKYANLCSEFLTFKKKPKRKHQKFTCPVCIKHFISDYFLKRHCLKHVPRKVKCNICETKFNSKFNLQEHKKMVHIMQSIYFSCNICGRCYNENKKLQLHKNHHKNLCCMICGKRYKSQTTHINHIHRHMKKCSVTTNKIKQYCSFCEKAFSNDNEFSLHVNKVHLQIKPYSCDMCEQTFYTEFKLKCHRKLHSVYRKEKCEFCNKSLYSREKLVIHIRKHIGEMPFCCDICNKSFYSQIQLTKHLRTIHNGKSLCKKCKLTFVTKKELKCHIVKVHNVI